MAKKKNKNGGKGIFGGNLGKAGTTLVSILVASIVETAIQQLLRKASTDSKKDKNADLNDIENAIEDYHHSDRNPIKSTVSKLQDNFEDTQISVKDAIEAINSTVNEYKPNWTDLLDRLKELTIKSTPLSLLGDRADMVLDGVANSTQNAIASVTSNDANKSDKKSKKKKKKK
jgi:uncharacterized membrane protein YheB (UPF0754 family)